MLAVTQINYHSQAVLVKFHYLVFHYHHHLPRLQQPPIPRHLLSHQTIQVVHQLQKLTQVMPRVKNSVQKRLRPKVKLTNIRHRLPMYCYKSPMLLLARNWHIQRPLTTLSQVNRYRRHVLNVNQQKVL